MRVRGLSGFADENPWYDPEGSIVSFSSLMDRFSKLTKSNFDCVVDYMMIPEAAMCGTPIVAFEMGGAPDLVETTQTGVLVRDFTAAALARGVGEALSAPDKECMGREIHRRSHARHAPHLVAERYINTLARIREEDGNARSNGEVAV